jgi:ribonuclease HI
MMKKVNGEYTESPEEAMDVLLKEHFPEGGNDEDVLGVDHEPMSKEIVEKIITRTKVEEAIMGFDPFKSPGPDGIYPVLLQKGGERLLEDLTEIMRGSLRLGYVPVGWRETRIAFIPKAAKERYDSPKAFRPVSLMSFLLKTLERMIVWHLLETKGVTLHKRQYAYQAGKSTEAALHPLVCRLEDAVYGGQFALSVLIDIEGAFSNTTFRSMEEAMIRFQVPPVIRRWVRFMLRTRVAWAEIKGCKRQREVGRGCPQGGVLSPLLFVMVVDDLLNLLSREEKAVMLVSFSDDLTLTIVGFDPGTMRQIMQRTLNRVSQWCETNDLSINPRKTEAIMFTRKRKWAMGPLKLNGVEIGRKNEVRLLGIILDSKLTWRQQCLHVKKKCLIALASVRRVVGRSWGLQPKMMKWIYTAVVRPMASYAAVIWCRAIKVKSYLAGLEKVQRTACLMITGAMRTTPGAAMENLLELPPIKVYLMKEAMRQATWLKMQGHWVTRGPRESHRTFCGRFLGQLEVLKYPQERSETRYCSNRNFDVIIEDGKGEEVGDGRWTIYTDGSRKDEMTGAGALIISPLGEKTEIRIPLGAEATVNQAELHAIMKAANTIKDEEGRSDVVLFSDSQVSLRLLRKRVVKAELVWECWRELNELGKNRKVTLKWVKAHAGTEGNEEADRLAKEATEVRFLGPEPVLPITRSRVTNDMKKIMAKWSGDVWRNTRGCRQSKENMSKLQVGDREYLGSLHRGDLRLMVAIFTGHCTLNRHMHLLGIADSAGCPKCGSREEDTPDHFMGRCPVFAMKRLGVFGMVTLDPGEWRTFKVERILRYVKETKRLTERVIRPGDEGSIGSCR